MAKGDSGLTFVLVHGAWHGGWCWSRVADILRSRGHRVTTPTMTGLGERSHLLSKLVNLTLHIDDLANHLVWEDLQQAIVVGHSYGGVPVMGAADIVPDRISRLIFLDAGIVWDGEALLDILPEAAVAERIAAAVEINGCLTLPPDDAAGLSITKAEDVAFVSERLTPHPLATYQEPLTLNGPLGNGLPIAYVACTNPAYPPVSGSHQRAREAGWPVYELATAHDAMVTDPEGTADILESIGAGKLSD